MIGTWCADWNPDVLQFSQFVLEWCECSWKIDPRKCQSENVPMLRFNPSVYQQLMRKMSVNRTIVVYPTVRSEIRTFNMQVGMYVR